MLSSSVQGLRRSPISHEPWLRSMGSQNGKKTQIWEGSWRGRARVGEGWGDGGGEGWPGRGMNTVEEYSNQCVTVASISSNQYTLWRLPEEKKITFENVASNYLAHIEYICNYELCTRYKTMQETAM